MFTDNIEELRELSSDDEPTVLNLLANRSFVVLLTQKFRIWIRAKKSTGNMNRQQVNKLRLTAITNTWASYMLRGRILSK